MQQNNDISVSNKRIRRNNGCINDHDSTIIKIHNEFIEIDNLIINLIVKLNKNKLITRGSCENEVYNDKSCVYILFEYFSFNEFIKLEENKNFKQFIIDECCLTRPYFSSNGNYKIEKQDLMQYNSQQEIWICVTFENKYIDKCVECL